jgi:hypothetical protein
MGIVAHYARGWRSRDDAASPDDEPTARHPAARRRQELPVPESRSRKKATFTPPPQKAVAKPNPRWWVPVMLGLMLLGLAWIVIFYIGRSVSGASLPIPALDTWNLAVGAVLIITGFAMTTRWR